MCNNAAHNIPKWFHKEMINTHQKVREALRRGDSSALEIKVLQRFVEWQMGGTFIRYNFLNSGFIVNYVTIQHGTVYRDLSYSCGNLTVIDYGRAELIEYSERELEQSKDDDLSAIGVPEGYGIFVSEFRRDIYLHSVSILEADRALTSSHIELMKEKRGRDKVVFAMR